MTDRWWIGFDVVCPSAMRTRGRCPLGPHEALEPATKGSSQGLPGEERVSSSTRPRNGRLGVCRALAPGLWALGGVPPSPGGAPQVGKLSVRPNSDSAFTALGAVSHQAIASVRIQPLVPLWTPVLGVT